MDNMHVSEWETIMVNLIASIFIKNNVEFTNRHDCWPKQTLSEIACFRKLCQNLFDATSKLYSKWRTVAKGVEYCVVLELFKSAYIKMERWINYSWAGYIGECGQLLWIN